MGIKINLYTSKQSRSICLSTSRSIGSKLTLNRGDTWEGLSIVGLKSLRANYSDPPIHPNPYSVRIVKNVEDPKNIKNNTHSEVADNLFIHSNTDLPGRWWDGKHLKWEKSINMHISVHSFTLSIGLNLGICVRRQLDKGQGVMCVIMQILFT